MNTDGTPDPWGVTTLEIFEQLADSLEAGADRAAATVVDVDGSAYRRPGAKMLVDADGTTYGGITAGCLEGPLRDVARNVLESSSPAVVTFDLTDGDEWGLGLGCEGIVDVLVEPVDPSWREAVAAYHGGEPASLVTTVDGPASVPVGSRLLVTAAGEVVEPVRRSLLASVDESDLDLERIRSRGHEHAVNGRTTTLSVDAADGTLEVLVDGIAPADRLLLFGGQPDVRPVTRLARAAGLRVTVATARGAQADPAAFPRADRVRSTRPPELAELVDDRTAVVLMSHNFLDDRLALESVLETDAPYVGLMGPRDRFRRMLDDLREDGTRLSERDRERIATPVGLDLGGGEPIEIALSIVSEVVAASNGREGGRLRDREGPIHDRPSQPN